ncbi:MAG: hypothetical protein WC966_07760 [Bradymonadales bacterium]
MLVYLVDDRGTRGEYMHFLKAYAQQLPPLVLHVFTHWDALNKAIQNRVPDAVILDMRFDETPLALLVDAKDLASGAPKSNEDAMKESRVRDNQGVLILRALRAEQYKMPVILFAALAPKQEERLLDVAAPLYIIEGLILSELRDTLDKIHRQALRRL